MRRSIIVGASVAFGLSLGACGGEDAPAPAAESDTGTIVDSTPPIDASTPDATTPDTSTTPDTPVVDSTPVDAPVDAPLDVPVSCTPTAVIRLKLNAYGGTLPATATATPSVCGKGPITIGTTRTDFAVPVGVNVFFTADGGSAYWPAGSVEWNRPAGSSGDEAMNVIQKTQLPLPDYDATKAHLYVVLNALPTATTCDASGWVVTVPGHAEAKVQYTGMGGFTIDPTLTSSTGMRSSVAIIQKIDPGAPVTVAATKTGCDVNFKLTPVFTGRVPLVAGAIVHAVGNVAVK